MDAKLGSSEVDNCVRNWTDHISSKYPKFYVEKEFKGDFVAVNVTCCLCGDELSATKRVRMFVRNCAELELLQKNLELMETCIHYHIVGKYKCRALKIWTSW